ncbi:MAG: Ig-like domain-containing protein [Parasphingorhabdus sp.]|uniref:Ig-like domain-containing protein n=1 Tax=Parasphingorhabdus sp. TaxID=2709688 RepID=UPI0032988450
MAFLTVEEWQVERRPLFSVISDLPVTILPRHLNSNFRINEFRKPVSLVLTLTIHLLLLFLVINSSNLNFSNGQARNINSSGGEMTMMGLSVKPDTEEQSFRDTVSKDSEVRATATQPNNIEASVRTELPVEWSISRISIPRTASKPKKSDASGGSSDNPPVANDDSLLTNCAVGVVDVLANDSSADDGALTVVSVSDGMGAIVRNNKIVIQTAYNGSLTYTIEDESGATATASIQVTNKCS